MGLLIAMYAAEVLGVLLLKDDRESRCWETIIISIPLCFSGHPNVLCILLPAPRTHSLLLEGQMSVITSARSPVSAGDDWVWPLTAPVVS